MIDTQTLRQRAFSVFEFLVLAGLVALLVGVALLIAWLLLLVSFAQGQ